VRISPKYEQKGTYVLALASKAYAGMGATNSSSKYMPMRCGPTPQTPMHSMALAGYARLGKVPGWEAPLRKAMRREPDEAGQHNERWQSQSFDMDDGPRRSRSSERDPAGPRKIRTSTTGLG